MRSSTITSAVLLGALTGLGGWVLHDAFAAEPATAGSEPVAAQVPATNLYLVAPRSTDQAQQPVPVVLWGNNDAPADPALGSQPVGATGRHTTGSEAGAGPRAFGRAAPLGSGTAAVLSAPPGSQPISSIPAAAAAGQKDQHSRSQATRDGSPNSGARGTKPAQIAADIRQASPDHVTSATQPTQVIPVVARNGKIITVPMQTGGPAGSSGARTAYQVVASQGAIVYIGDDGRLTAATGAVSSSGVVALDVNESSLTAGNSSGSNVSESQADKLDASSPIPNGSLGVLLGAADTDGGNATSISGFEDHSVSVRGDDQIVTYDDSNVFLDRDGLINANTGDTDSSGLNAVDVTGSTVRAGNSGDGESLEDEAEEEDTDEAEEADEEDGERSAARPAVQDRTGSRPEATQLSSERADSEDDDDTEDGDDQNGTSGSSSGRAQGAVTDEGASTASGDDAFVIGADGYDDVSIRTDGKRNIITYDDSNVVIGGSGKVNAQIGDSDTGGAVVMGIKDSDVRAGCEGDLCYSGLQGQGTTSAVQAPAAPSKQSQDSPDNATSPSEQAPGTTGEAEQGDDE